MFQGLICEINLHKMTFMDLSIAKTNFLAKINFKKQWSPFCFEAVHYLICSNCFIAFITVAMNHCAQVVC